MNGWTDFIITFVTLFLELAVLFIFISFLISLLQQNISEDKIKRMLDRPNKFISYLYGVGLGAISPFCSCSTIPILAGLLSSGAPFGPTMTFLIASPLLNPVIIILIGTLMGWNAALFYTVIVAIFAILIGVVWKTLGLADFVKEVRVRKSKTETEHNTEQPKWRVALQDAWGFFYPVLPFLVIGVLIGSFIHGFLPEEIIVRFAGGDQPWAIPVASIIGIPMYIRAEAILPIADALVSKGMGIGSIIALVIGGAGASIPEVVLLSKLFKRRLVIAFLISILSVAIIAGFIAQSIL
ncbi:permease [Paraliobacillus sp. X-1268]|uniref:permease n=1 Tax=Paraliobacillus sp. X-1268 TaxID=2213193 RepID=UPI000E3DB8AE|nr:permease [Paraliobacillus sp. X-1268]